MNGGGGSTTFARSGTLAVVSKIASVEAPDEGGASVTTTCLAVGDELELTIDALGSHAEGIGTFAGSTVHVPFALPTESVRVRVWRFHGLQADADLLQVLVTSPARIAPGCALFGTCGGCQLQDLPYGEQLAWKTSIVRANFRRVGLEGAVTDCVASPREYGYRSKLTPHYEPARGDAPVAIGFLRQGRRHEVVDVPSCPIATDAINAGLPALRATARAAASGRRRGASLIMRDATSGLTSDPDARIRERVGAIELEFFAREFFQNNPFLLPTLVDFVVEHAVATRATVLIDTYSGSGLFALSAARRFERVLGVEVSTVAVATARANAARNQLTNVEFMAASAERIFHDMTVAGESAVVVLDPPRKGADDRFLSQVIAFRPRALIYVSCNPETAARDIARLVEAGFLLSTVQPFDMFPQTRHVECVAVLRR